MKIGIITFHKAINYGAVLQAYALKTALINKGYDAQIINYVNPKMLSESKVFYRQHNQSLTDKLLTWFRIPMRSRTVKKFNSFIDNYVVSSTKIISSTEELALISKKYDKIITGSDQVFNYYGTGEDFNFYLDFLHDCDKKIAYAPSFGLNEIDDEHIDRVKRCLSSFNTLTAREIVGQNIIKSLTGREAPLVCDPTFLLEKKIWQEISTNPKFKKPYVLIYSFGSSHLENLAMSLAEILSAEVVNINRSLPRFIRGKTINAYAPNPFEFIGLIKGAECIVTNSFHGTALSILLEKDFYTVNNNAINSSATNNRFYSLLAKLGLESRLIQNQEIPKFSQVDYIGVTPKITQWRNESLNILIKSL